MYARDDSARSDSEVIADMCHHSLSSSLNLCLSHKHPLPHYSMATVCGSCLAMFSLYLLHTHSRTHPSTSPHSHTLSHSPTSHYSMATVCGCCLAMLDAGVPLKSSVAGVAMGLILGEERREEKREI